MSNQLEERKYWKAENLHQENYAAISSLRMDTRLGVCNIAMPTVPYPKEQICSDCPRSHPKQLDL